MMVGVFDGYFCANYKSLELIWVFFVVDGWDTSNMDMLLTLSSPLGVVGICSLCILGVYDLLITGVKEHSFIMLLSCSCCISWAIRSNFSCFFS